MEKRNMDVGWLVETAKRHKDEYSKTYFIAFGPGSEPEVQVGERGLLELAQVEDWKWRSRLSDADCPHEAFVMMDEVKFYTILTDEERRDVLDGTLFAGNIE